MSQRQQLERIFEIDRQIRAGLYPTADSLSQELEVSRRVIFNDRQFLRDRLSAPLAFDRKHGGWSYTEPTWTLPTAFVTEGELLALFLSIEVAQRYMGTVFEEPLKAAVAKLARSVQGEVSINLDALRGRYTFAQPASVAANEETLLGLDRAITQRRAVHMRYYTASRGETGERIVHPRHLHNVEGDWHLFAFDRNSRKIKTFHVGRVEAWRMLDETFQREPEFDAAALIRSVFQSEVAPRPVRVAVRFDTYQARYIRERKWHETQQIEELPDGGLILRFGAGGLGEVKRWIMRYGSHAEFLEPEELRREVAEEARLMMEVYQTDKGPL